VITIVDKLCRANPIKSAKEPIGQEDTPWTIQARRVDLVPGREPIQVEFRFDNSRVLIGAHVYRGTQNPGTTPEINSNTRQAGRTAVSGANCRRSRHEAKPIVVSAKKVIRSVGIRRIDKPRAGINIISSINPRERIPPGSAAS